MQLAVFRYIPCSCAPLHKLRNQPTWSEIHGVISDKKSEQVNQAVTRMTCIWEMRTILAQKFRNVAQFLKANVEAVS
jgi:hypothetical protein